MKHEKRERKLFAFWSSADVSAALALLPPAPSGSVAGLISAHVCQTHSIVSSSGSGWACSLNGPISMTTGLDTESTGHGRIFGLAGGRVASWVKSEGATRGQRWQLFFHFDARSITGQRSQPALLLTPWPTSCLFKFYFPSLSNEASILSSLSFCVLEQFPCLDPSPAS